MLFFRGKLNRDSRGILVREQAVTSVQTLGVMKFVHFSFRSSVIQLFCILAISGDEEQKLFDKSFTGAVDAIYEPVSITALLGSCLYDENAQWSSADEANFRLAIIDQLRSMCENEKRHGFCIDAVDISHVRVFFDGTSTKQQRMFWQTKLTLLYPDNPYLAAHVNLETPIFDKEILSGILAELSQRPNSSIPGWAIVDFERPSKIDPTLQLINLYILPAGAVVIAATLFAAWVGIKIRTSTTEREMESLREYKAAKKQRDFLRRQRDQMSANYHIIKKHLSTDLQTPQSALVVPEVEKRKRNLGTKATEAICASVANTAIKLTAGSLELDHDLRLKFDVDETTSPPSTVSSAGEKKTGGDGGRKTNRPTILAFRRRAVSNTAPKERSLTVRTHFLLTPVTKLRQDPSLSPMATHTHL